MSRAHHTKSKGDIAVAHAHTSLTSQGFLVLLPVTEHAHFDLVGYRDGRFTRVQVKYRSASNGVVEVAFKSTWADRHGTHTSLMDKDQVDLVCVYCPDTNHCYWIDPLEFPGSVKLRLLPAANGQRKGINMADLYTQIPARYADADR